MKQAPTYVCLLLIYALIFSNCSKEPIIDDIDNGNDTKTVMLLDEPVKQYMDAQLMMNNLLTTAITETVRTTVIPPFLNTSSASCVEYIDSSGMPMRQTIDIKITFGDATNACDPGNGHLVQGTLYIQSFANSILETGFGTNPAFIRFTNNQITIDDYTFKLIKEDPNEGGQDLKFFNGGPITDPQFQFVLSDKTYFELTNDVTGEKTTIVPPYSPRSYMKIVPTLSIANLNYSDLYDNIDTIKFEQDITCDPMIKVTTFDDQGDTTGIFRVITEYQKDLIINPSKAYPLGGQVNCLTPSACVPNPYLPNIPAGALFQSFVFNESGGLFSVTNCTYYDTLGNPIVPDCITWDLN